MKYAVFTVSMPEYAPEAAAAFLKEAGYEGVEWRLVPGKPYDENAAPAYWTNNRCELHEEDVLANAEKIGKLCREYGLAMPSLGAYAGCGSPERAKLAIEAAARLGAPCVRIGCPGYDPKRGYRAVYEEGVEQYAKVEQLAKEYGVRACIETHPGNITPSASAAYRFVSNFDSRYVGVIYDAGNMVNEGYENFQMGLEILGEYLAHVHIKNERHRETVYPYGGYQHWKADACEMWKGEVDTLAVLRALKSVGYDGWLSFEDFYTGMTTEEKLRGNLAFMRELEAQL